MELSSFRYGIAFIFSDRQAAAVRLQVSIIPKTKNDFRVDRYVQTMDLNIYKMLIKKKGGSKMKRKLVISTRLELLRAFWFQQREQQN